MTKTISELKKSFQNPDLFEQSLTHRSWVNENRGQRESNERLEFLGDAILEYVVSNHLYQKFPDQNEGYLTALRANLVNTRNLASVAQKLKLGELLYLSKGEEEGGGRENPSLLADTVEAVIGAVYIDQGLKAANSFIQDHLLTTLSEKLTQPLKDAKSRLQEMVQAQGSSTPKYQVLEESGPDHSKKFIVEVLVDKQVLAQGQGPSKNKAEQDAAEKALKKQA